MIRKYALVNYDGDRQCNVIADISLFDNIKAADECAKAIYGKAAFAMDAERYDVSRDDSVRGNVFYNYNPETKEETEAEYIPTEADRISRLENDKRILQAQNNDLILAMAELIGGE